MLLTLQIAFCEGLEAFLMVAFATLYLGKSRSTGPNWRSSFLL